MKLYLAVPERGCELRELERVLTQCEADLYVFPESFLHDATLEAALSLARSSGARIIAGYRDERGQHAFERALAIEQGRIVDTYTKCILTGGERAKGRGSGDGIRCLRTSLGPIGVPICYEVHFPEVARIMELEHPALMLNLIGTGMHDDMQCAQWLALARARAIENEVCIAGCSHRCGSIPIAFAYTAQGVPLCEVRDARGGVSVDIDISDSAAKRIGYFDDRRPELFARLCK